MTRTPARIALLTPTLAGADGVSCLARQYAAALGAIGAPGGVDVWTLTEDVVPPAAVPAGVRVHATGGSRVRFVMRALAASGHDWRGALVVVLHLNLLPVAWPLVARGARLLPVLVGIEAWRPLNAVRRRLLARAPCAIAISGHTAREFVHANPACAGLDVTICHPATPPILPAGTLPVAVSPPFALIAGRMASDERYKGHDLLIDVWPRVREAVSDARLVVAGGGDDLARLRARVDDAGLSGAITFTGRVSDAELGALYDACACLVLPSRHEGFGFVLLEAMQRGRACIGGVGAASEIIEDGRTGFVVDPARPETIVSALVTLLGDEATRQAMGEAGRRRAAASFAPARFGADLARVVERTMAGDAC